MPAIKRKGRKKTELRNLLKRGSKWYFKKEVGGKVKSISLNTTDLELAKVRRNNLEKLAHQEKWKEIDELGSKRSVATIGEVIGRYEKATDLQLAQRTYENNVWALRLILKRVKGLDNDAAVDGLATSVLDGGLAREWQRLCLEKAGADKLKLDSASVSANSMLAQARSLFGKDAMARKIYEGLKLPDLAGFRSAPRLNELKRDSYQKPADELLRQIWKAAHVLRDGASESLDPTIGKESAVAKEPALWLVFWLASQTGLRKGEMTFMRYRWFESEFVRTCFEADFVPKGKRERDVPVVAAVEVECRRVAKENGWPTEDTDYVLPGSQWMKEKLFKAFGRWMRAQGWTRRQKAHELRKIFASDFLETSTPYDAQLALGHRDLKTTSRYAARRSAKAVDQSARYGELTVLPDPPAQAAADESPVPIVGETKAVA